MTTSLPQTDETLEALLAELTKLKSVTDELQDAGEAAGAAVRAAETVGQLVEKIIEDGKKQLTATAELSASTTQRLDSALAAQESLAAFTRRFFEADLRPQLEERLDKIIAGHEAFTTETRGYLVAELQPVLEKRLDAISAAQADHANDLRRFLETDLRPHLARYQHAAKVNRRLLLFLLIATLTNLGFVVWLALLR